MYDTNMDGSIDFSEFMMALQIMSSGTLGKMVGIKDKDEATREVFNEMDEDGDGEVTKDEFVKACLAQKKFSVMLTLFIIDIFLSN